MSGEPVRGRMVALFAPAGQLDRLSNITPVQEARIQGPDQSADVGLVCRGPQSDQGHQLFDVVGLAFDKAPSGGLVVADYLLNKRQSALLRPVG